MRSRVLVVEDDPQMLGYLAGLLESWGYDVRRAGSATAAVESVRESCPNIILSDLLLPGMDGVELLRQLRTTSPCAEKQPPATCFPLFILLTGQTSVSSAVRAIMEGADEVLVKPLDEVRLLTLLQNYEAQSKL